MTFLRLWRERDPPAVAPELAGAMTVAVPVFSLTCSTVSTGPSMLQWSTVAHVCHCEPVLHSRMTCVRVGGALVYLERVALEGLLQRADVALVAAGQVGHVVDRDLWCDC
jgi:hypothetical protein